VARPPLRELVRAALSVSPRRANSRRRSTGPSSGRRRLSRRPSR
jgi:hypothetical protein